MSLLPLFAPPRTTPGAPAPSRTLRTTELYDRLTQADLLQEVVPGEQIDPETACTLVHITADSRAVRPGACFVAVSGHTTDGHDYISDAIEHGAVLVIAERLPEQARSQFPQVRFVRVSDARKALGHAAAAYYDDPAQELTMIGVTGTNGKTTTAYLTYHGLQATETPAGLISTIEVRSPTLSVNADLTTPGAIDLQRTLRRMVDDGCTACVMEVSSHALDQARTVPVAYDVAIFTNLTADHLDYHGSTAAYRAAKKQLFDGCPPDATALYNADDEAGSEMVATTRARPVSYGTDPAADIRIRNMKVTLRGLSMELDGHPASFRVTGRFNAYNLAAAYGALRATGVDADQARQALVQADPVPGRFERLPLDIGPTVIVDYAHTPDALESILQSLRPLTPSSGRLWCVFGCGGDRDTGKRRVMGALAESYADRVIVTNDNPRTEDPQAILNDIRRGMSRPAEAQWIPNRKTAIHTAAQQAGSNDVVLIAGKGHETYQIIGTDRHAFDDRAVARQYFLEYHDTNFHETP